MSSYKTKLVKQNIKLLAANSKKTVRKHLNADAMIKLARKEFKKIPDHRAKNASISLEDTLMSTLAMFLLKDPSLLAFDNRLKEEPENLIFGVIDIPCDSQMPLHTRFSRPVPPPGTFLFSHQSVAAG